MSRYFGGGVFTYELLVPLLRKSGSAYVYNDTQPASGIWATSLVGTGIEAFCHFKCPDKMISLDACDIVTLPNTTETITCDVDVLVAANGEAYNTHTGSISALSFVSTINQLLAVSALAAIPAATAAGDYVAFRITGGGNEQEMIGVRLSFKVSG